MTIPDVAAWSDESAVLCEVRGDVSALFGPVSLSHLESLMGWSRAVVREIRFRGHRVLCIADGEGKGPVNLHVNREIGPYVEGSGVLHGTVVLSTRNFLE
jgi:hypothetical protein